MNIVHAPGLAWPPELKTPDSSMVVTTATTTATPTPTTGSDGRLRTTVV